MRVYSVLTLHATTVDRVPSRPIDSNAPTAIVRYLIENKQLIQIIYLIFFFFIKEILMPPIVSPYHQSVPVGSSTQLTCEKSPSSLFEPDRFQWYKRKQQQSETTNNNDDYDTGAMFDLKKSIGYGSVLTIDNITLADAGWYVCCMLTAPATSVDERKEAIAAADQQQQHPTLDVKINYACSSAQIEVEQIQIVPPVATSKSFRVILALVLLVCFVVIGLMALVLYFCHEKLKIFKRTHEAVSALQNVIIN